MAQKVFIDGEWVEGNSGEFFDVVNPATEAVIDRVPQGTREDAQRALEAAEAVVVVGEHVGPHGDRVPRHPLDGKAASVHFGVDALDDGADPAILPAHEAAHLAGGLASGRKPAPGLTSPPTPARP